MSVFLCRAFGLGFNLAGSADVYDSCGEYATRFYRREKDTLDRCARHAFSKEDLVGTGWWEEPDPYVGGSRWR